ncbi:MAG: hypothetical protein MAG453_00045 [Calditrichaeota bacterium]|nr:hypothetical protein [Calditrichota bacterium]
MTSHSLSSALRALARDREHGAAEIVHRTCDALLRAFEQGVPPDPGALNTALAELRRGQPSMAPVLRFTAELSSALAHSAGGESADIARTVAEVAGRWRDKLTRAGEQFREQLRRRFRADAPLATFSYSSTVLAGFEALREIDIPRTVYAGLSWPGEEGVRTAAALREAGFEPVLVSDTRLAELVYEGEAVPLILGCDALTGDRFTNKSGSGALAAIAFHGRGSAQIWTTTHKFLGARLYDKLVHDSEADPPAAARQQQIPAELPLFGEGRTEHIDTVWTERGPLKPAEITRITETLNAPVDRGGS